MKIAIIGKMGSGKSYIAKYLEDKHNFKIMSFGYPVKKYAAKIFNLQYKNRSIIQDFAQKVKEIDPDIWIKYLIRNLPDGNIVIDDLRFPNEYDYLKKKGFVFIKLILDKDLQINRLKYTYPNNYQDHISRLNDISEIHTEVLESDYTVRIDLNNQNQIYDIVDGIIHLIKENTILNNI